MKKFIIILLFTILCYSCTSLESKAQHKLEHRYVVKHHSTLGCMVLTCSKYERLLVGNNIVYILYDSNGKVKSEVSITGSTFVRITRNWNEEINKEDT